MARTFAGVLFSLILAVTVGGGAPLHLVQAHADVSVSGHDCAICKSLYHDPGHLDAHLPAAPSDPGCVQLVAANPCFVFEDFSSTGSPRAPPSFLA